MMSDIMLDHSSFLIPSFRVPRLYPAINTIPRSLRHAAALWHRFFNYYSFQHFTVVQQSLDAFISTVIVRAGATSAMATQAIMVDNGFDIGVVGKRNTRKGAGRAFGVVFAAGIVKDNRKQG